MTLVQLLDANKRTLANYCPEQAAALLTDDKRGSDAARTQHCAECRAAREPVDSLRATLAPHDGAHMLVHTARKRGRPQQRR